MTPTLLAALVGEALADDHSVPPSAAPGSVRAVGTNPYRWRIVGEVTVEGASRGALLAALARRPEIARVHARATTGPIDVELSDSGFAAALRRLQSENDTATGAPGGGRDDLTLDPASTGSDVRGPSASPLESASSQEPDGSVVLAQYAHARAVRRLAAGGRCGVRSDLLAARADDEQLRLLQALLDTPGALDRAAAAPEPVRSRRLRAHVASLARRVHAAFDAVPSRPLGDGPITDGHAVALALDGAAAAALAAGLTALGAPAPDRL